MKPCQEKAAVLPRFEYGTGTAEMASTKHRMRGDFPLLRVAFSSSQYHFKGTVEDAPPVKAKFSIMILSPASVKAKLC